MSSKFFKLIFLKISDEGGIQTHMLTVPIWVFFESGCAFVFLLGSDFFMLLDWIWLSWLWSAWVLLMFLVLAGIAFY